MKKAMVLKKNMIVILIIVLTKITLKKVSFVAQVAYRLCLILLRMSLMLRCPSSAHYSRAIRQETIETDRKEGDDS